jgi:hypothetical protein
MKQEPKQAPTFESVWALLQENAQQMKESSAKFDMEMAETRADFDRRMREEDQRREASSAKFDKEMAETRTDFDRQMKKLKVAMDETNRHIFGVTKSNGDFAEDYFFNAFNKEKQNFFGEEFDRIIKGKGRVVEDEYDAVLINGKTAGIIEVKYKARREDIAQALKKPRTFRINFPEYKDHKIYLALAALTINESLERECIRQGIAVIKQVGDKVVVGNKHLKAF